MYNITLRSSGYILKFGGSIDKDEMQRWYDESVETLKASPKSFGVIIDMTTLHPLEADVQNLMVEGQGLYKESGMHRSAVLTPNPILTMQFTRLAKESGIYETERYFDGNVKGAIENAIAWVKDEIYNEVEK